MKKIELKAQAEKLDFALSFIDEFLEDIDCPKEIQFVIDIAVEELFVNISYYAYVGESGQITLKISEEKGIVCIILEDDGKPYNPWAKQDPDITLSAEEREIGGLGIYMVKKSMDEVAYDYCDGKNIVTLKKRIR